MGLLGSLFGKKEKNDPPYPSWASDSEKLDSFISTLKEKAKQKGIPEKFLGGVMTNEYGRDKLFFTAGLMEQHGASYDDQVKAVIDHIEKYWSNMDNKETWYR